MTNPKTKTVSKKEQKVWKSRYVQAIMIFSMVCFVTSLILSFDVGEPLAATLPNAGGLVGPLDVPDNNVVYEVEVKQAVSDSHWSFVTAELLDKNKAYLFSFGDEFWTESGYDEGPWSETNASYDMKITIEEKGIYYFSFSSEVSQLNQTGAIYVTITRQIASFLPHLWIGILTLLLGLVLFYRLNS